MSTDHNCPECGKRRINTPSGSVCPDGHGRLHPTIEEPRLFDDDWIDDEEKEDDDDWDF
jgi:hypothetical protein